MSDADVVREALDGRTSVWAPSVAGHAALDRLVARLAEAERDRNLFRDTLAKANEHAALLEDALADVTDALAVLRFPGGHVSPHEASMLADKALEVARPILEARARLALGGVRGGEEQRT